MRKTIDRFPGYEIDDEGVVWSLRSRRSLTPSYAKGYMRVSLTIDGKCRLERVHRLVLEAFRGPCPLGYESRHLNGIRSDNRLANLMWGTSSENRIDQKRHGTAIDSVNGIRGAVKLRRPRLPIKIKPAAGLYTRTKLTEDDVREIRRALAAGASSAALARKYGVHVSAVQRANNGQRWGHVA